VSTPERGFDRLRHRRADGPGRAAPGAAPRDPLGRSALYSVAEQPAALGAVSVDCSACRVTSVVTPRRLLRLAMPSLHLPVLGGRHPSWMRCPSCGRRAWVRLGVRL
jgi:hypothetical protein